MRERVCKNCGGRKYIVVGQNMTKCAFCGTLYVDEHASKEEVVLIVGANEILRELRFEDAYEEYEKILEVYPQSFEGYFGKALAKNKIVIYPNQSGKRSRPRFFDKIVNLQEDEDFNKAISLAPSERAKEMNALAARTAKIHKAYLQKTSQQNFDVIFCAAGYGENADENEKIAQIKQILQKNGRNVYFLQENLNKEKEEESFRALETAKLFVFATCVQDNFVVYKHILDRYKFFIKLRKKPRSSFVLLLESIKQNQLPKFFSGLQNVLNTTSETFFEDLQILVEKEIANFSSGTAKIKTVRLQTQPIHKKEYVDVESISLKELGSYNVETLDLSSENNLKWVFLCLKNGDFETAQEQIATELKNNPYSSEFLFASLMCERKLKTQEEFFSSISNFSDKEKIDNILRYSNKQFAEFFVDTWEALIEKLDNEEVYAAYIEYLSSFATANREKFIKRAEEKAVETLYQPLIEKVEKCFDKTDVDRFVDFYYALAQKSEDDKYYDMILQLDAGHMQSNFALILKHFKTVQDKLSYRNAEEVEGMLKFMNDTARVNFVEKVVELILPVAFYDLKAAAEQLDFYLAYLPDDASLARLCEKASISLKQMRFFKEAEKYITIAINKSERKAELYWQLIQIRAHCRSESELITSQVKISSMPEWKTLLQYADNQQGEAYAQIVSKSNLYKGERQSFLPDALDKKQLTEAINQFLLRNNKILLEFEKQNLNGAAYYTSQLKPFEKYVQQISKVKDYDAFCDIAKKVKVRLNALDLNLDMSISALTLSGRFNNIKVPTKETETVPKKDHKKFVKRFCFGFVQLFPLLLATILMFASVVSPKAVYKIFSYKVLVAFAVISGIIGVFNIVWFILKRKKLTKLWKNVYLTLFSFAFLNVCLFLFGYFVPVAHISINSAREMAVLIKNAKHANFVLNDDIDFNGKTWSSLDFSGKFNGNNHKITNIVLNNGGVFNHNSGKVVGLVIEVQKVKSAPAEFGLLANVNTGSLENCIVSGDIKLNAANIQNFGGLVGVNSGKIERCESYIIANLAKAKQINVGGIVGSQTSGKNAQIFQCKASGDIVVQAQTANIGGLVGSITSTNLYMQQNVAQTNIVLREQTQESNVGGLVGSGDQPAQDCRAVGSITVESGSANVGGLYGTYENVKDVLQKCYANVEINFEEAFGTLFGILGGRAYNCFSIQAGAIFVENLPFGGVDINTETGLEEDEFYNSKFGFSTKIWNVSEFQYPILKWEQA